VIAAGSQGRVHARGYQSAPQELNAVLVAVADPDTAAAREAGVQLTVNLQRRFEPVHRFAREQIDAGAIGAVVSLEGYCPNLPDWGSHVVDLILFYQADRRPAWVIGQVDVTVNRYVYGAFAETSSLTQIRWDDGVGAVIVTGREPQTPVLNLENNLGLLVQGTAGRLDARGARCVVHRFFATYESSRSRRRVPLPLHPHDNALLSGLSQGFWRPAGEQRSTY